MSVQKLSHFCTYNVSVIKMECVQKQCSAHLEVKPALIRAKVKPISKQTEVYDKASAEFRRYLASEAAIHQLEQRKNLSTAAGHRMSFTR